MSDHDSDAGVAIRGIVDTHCHLGPVDAADGDACGTGDLVDAAEAAGLEILVDVGIDLRSSRRATTNAETFGSVRATVGLHPCSSDRFDAEWSDLSRLAHESSPVALGETGFDFHWQPDRRDVQERSFRAHLELARELDLAVVVHARDAFEATFEVLEDARDLRVVWHCFGGGIAEAERAVELGCWLSFAGPLTYRRSDELRLAASRIPGDRVLVETDAPFLPPQSARGRRNQPAYVVETLRCLAGIRGWTLQEAADLTRSNARSAFGPRLLPD